MWYFILNLQRRKIRLISFALLSTNTLIDWKFQLFLYTYIWQTQYYSLLESRCIWWVQARCSPFKSHAPTLLISLAQFSPAEVYRCLHRFLPWESPRLAVQGFQSQIIWYNFQVIFNIYEYIIRTQLYILTGWLGITVQWPQCSEQYHHFTVQVKPFSIKKMSHLTNLPQLEWLCIDRPWYEHQASAIKKLIHSPVQLLKEFKFLIPKAFDFALSVKHVDSIS